MLRPISTRAVIAVASVAAALVAGGGADRASAQAPRTQTGACLDKAASGTSLTEDGARFQAWQAILEAIDFQAWIGFVASDGKVGTAPGYRVSQYKAACAPGGFGHTCQISARLCRLR